MEMQKSYYVVTYKPAYLALLQSKYPVSEIGPDGKVKPIDDKERDSRIAGVNDRIAQFCGN